VYCLLFLLPGQYRDDKRNGQGIYKWKNGDKYQGNMNIWYFQIWIYIQTIEHIFKRGISR
jgi:hypothetical protein